MRSGVPHNRTKLSGACVDRSAAAMDDCCHLLGNRGNGSRVRCSPSLGRSVYDTFELFHKVILFDMTTIILIEELPIEGFYGPVVLPALSDS